MPIFHLADDARLILRAFAEQHKYIFQRRTIPYGIDFPAMERQVPMVADGVAGRPDAIAKDAGFQYRQRVGCCNCVSRRG